LTIITPNISRLLDLWLDEDIGRGDLSQPAIENKIVSACWICKQQGVFCGGELVKSLYQRLDKSVEIKLHRSDGEEVIVGEKVMELNGPVSSLLAGERTALNLVMHLSGIATTTKKLVSALEGTNVQLADTRKTTPGLRQLEKYAVRCGGGINHRLGLDDAAMLKENHIAWSKGITKSIEALKENLPWTSKIIVEAETSKQAIEAVSAGADGVLLDEMKPDDIRKLIPQLKAITKNNSKEVIIEASGIDPKHIRDYASTGIDIISSSAPISQSTWIDFSMRFSDKRSG